MIWIFLIIILCSPSGALVGNGEEDLAAAIERVREENPSNGGDSDDEDAELEESWRVHTSKKQSQVEERREESEGEPEGASACEGAGGDRKAGCACAPSAVVEHSLLGGGDGNAKGQLTVFHSAAAEYLQKREYKGLVRGVEENAEMGIRQGQYGIAAGYSVHNADDAGKEEN